MVKQTKTYPLSYTYKTTASISQKQYPQLTAKLQQTKKDIKTCIQKKDYDSCYASTVLPFDTTYHAIIQKLVKQLHTYKPAYVVVIGIGGSHLGVQAIYEATFGKLYNTLPHTKGQAPKLLFVDTVDTTITKQTIQLVENALTAKQNIILNSISKSGGTTEAIANTQIFINLLEKYKKDAHKYVVITTDNNSKYMQLAHKKKYHTLPIPKEVGGRFSVFSAVGLFPLAMAGINTKELCNGAQASLTHALTTKNSCTNAAITAYSAFTQKKNIHDTFIFNQSFESVGKWLRQLIGESLGKEYDKTGKKQLYTGMTPTVSIGSSDLHSVAQLYLGGPFDKYTTFMIVPQKNSVKVPLTKAAQLTVAHIAGKSQNNIMDAIVQGVLTAFKKNKRPHSVIELKDTSAYTIGALLQFFMCQIIFTGTLMNINTFNQPNVESYKIETKKILSK